MGKSRRRAVPGEVIQSGFHNVARLFRKSLALGISPDGWLAIEGPILVAEAFAVAGYLRPDARLEQKTRKGRKGPPQQHSEETREGRKGPPLQRPEDPATKRAPEVLKIHRVLVTERQAGKFAEVLKRLPPESEVNPIAEGLFARVAQTETPRGIAALVELPERNLDEVAARPDALVVVACGLQDPGNLGAIVRSAQALGASALVALPNTVSPFNPKAARASAGAVLRLPLFTGLEPETLFQRLHSLGFQIVATVRRGPVPVQDSDLRGRVAILIGQEATGLGEDLAAQADLQVGIPMRPDTDSLNAAAAASIVLYEAARQRGFHFDEPV